MLRRGLANADRRHSRYLRSITRVVVAGAITNGVVATDWTQIPNSDRDYRPVDPGFVSHVALSLAREAAWIRAGRTN